MLLHRVILSMEVKRKTSRIANVAKPFCLNNREGGTVNTDLLGFVELMTSCSTGL